jgi:alkylated DNA repair dioxygenase AlkB
MEYCKHYYDVADDGYERDSRVHVSLSSRVAGDASFPMSNKLGDPEYMYRAVNSASALPLSLFPPVHGLAQNLAELYRLPNNEWNIGVDLVCYRDGDDHIGWHADDKLGEALVLSIVVDSKTVIRPVLVKPKTDNLGFRDGDEEIILFITEGDAYEMDGQMQMYYEHSVPKKSGDPSASRSVVVFRHGRATVVDSDSSLEYEIENSSDNVGVVPVINSNEPNQSKQSNLHFGHVTGILEAKRFYTREDLETAGAHIHQVKCINGSIRDGCDSLLLNSQASNLREDDGLIWFQITSCRSEGGGALCRNYHRNLPVRVFRSSELNNKYAPHVRENGKAMYRYDGLYTVCAMWDKDGNETDIYPPLNGAQHTFFLTRLPKKPLDIMMEKGLYYNRVGLQELWSEIQKKRGARKPRMFEIPEPLMKLPAIDGNVDRVDKVKPSSNDGSVIKKAKRGRKPKKAKIEADTDKEPQTEAPKDDKADILVENTVSVTKVDVEDSDSSAVSRSKRASAVAARTYLKEVMQNRYGDTEPEESLPSKKSAITPSGHDDEDECDDTQPNKRLKKTSDSENDVCPSPDENVRGDICDRNENKDNEDLVDRTVELKELETKDDEMSVDGNDHVSIADSHQKNDDDSNSQISEKDIEDTKSHDNSSEITDSSNSDAKNISEGARIHVEYKNTLFKATVRKTRKKGKVTQYLIHYDGNKKSNVHWIHHSKVHEILSTSLDEDFITNMEIQKPKRGRKRKSSTAIDDSDDNMKGNKASDKVDDVEDYQFKFSEGADIYAEYKEVLYLATIRSSRVNKKGIPEYFIHYHGFKRTSDRFVPEVNVLEINPTTTRRFNKMRADAQNNEFKDLQNESVGKNELSTETSSVAKTTRKKNSGAELNSTLDMGDLIPGVEFLPGSSVFVVFKNALYLAKMVKRRKRGKETDYKVHFAGIQDAEDEWVPLSTIYEINPHSRRIFEKTANVRKENDEESNAASGADRVTGPNSKKRKEDNEQNTGKDSKVATSKSSQSSNGIDLSGVTSGVDFLPGSTVFVNWKKGLYLGKMLKRRGKGDYMEYLIHYDGYKKSFDDWVSVDSVYEINAQTKRIYGRQNK